MTQDQHLLMDDLQPFAMYTCRVAAYTVKRGPFSQPLTIVLSSGMLTCRAAAYVKTNLFA